MIELTSEIAHYLYNDFNVAADSETRVEDKAKIVIKEMRISVANSYTLGDSVWLRHFPELIDLGVGVLCKRRFGRCRGARD